MAAISLVRIKPLDSGSFIQVTTSPTDASTYYLDWYYSAVATETVTLEITTDGSPVTVTATIEVVAEATEKLFLQTKI